jgi:site-specific DNA recombinase
MKENARQGFYNGSRVPLGYTVEDVETRGHRTKKRLIIDPVEAETVRLIFKLYLEGDGTSGPLGVKEVVKTLNGRGIRGLAHCACCGSAMTMRTGTSKTGKIYRYYSCSGAARMGKTACNGRSIQMDKLDQLVTSHIADRLLVPDRITDLLAEIIERRAMSRGEVRDRIDQLSREASAAEDKLLRLYALVEDGVTDLDDVLKTRLTDIKADRDRARSALDRIKERSSAASIDRVKIERFGALMRGNITTGDIPFRKAYLRWLIDAVEVDDGLIRIHGSKSTLEQAIVANSQADKGVRSFVRKWRSLGESNLCFSLERAK